jgi:hypothetical protein
MGEEDDMIFRNEDKEVFITLSLEKSDPGH